MSAPQPIRIAATLLLAFGATGCGATSAVTTDPNGLPADSIAGLEAIYRARVDSARRQFTEADVDFMTGMIAHHAQALVMAALAPTHGAGPEVRTLAARIANAQQDEIDTMQQWLRDRDQPVPEIRIEGITLTVDGAADHAAHMPGMLTPQQLTELDRATGRRFDSLFLTFMIQHHAGAVTMVEHLFSVDGAAQDDETFRLASGIHVDQITEIARMERMLDELPNAASESVTE